MRTFDLTPYRRSTIGFDRLFDMLEASARQTGDNYPPFNLERTGEDHLARAQRLLALSHGLGEPVRGAQRMAQACRADADRCGRAVAGHQHPEFAE